MNVLVTVALLPALFAPSSAPERPVSVRASASIDGRSIRSASAGGAGDVELEPSHLAAEATTTTAAPPTTVAPRPTTTVARRVAVAAPTTTVKPAPTTTTRPTTTTTAAPRPKPAPTTTAPPPAPPSSSRTESGKASWYDHEPGICAHKTLPFGTVVTVTATASGRSTTCTVGDRGPFIDGWVIDLHPEQFEQLAPRSTGVIAVRLDW